MSGTLQRGRRLHKRYTILKILGAGDFGTVYLARDRKAVKGPEHVAIKQMPMQMIVDCERQADLRANLTHPAIPRIFGYFVTDAHAYLVTSFIDGANLEETLDQWDGHLPVDTVTAWGLQLCDALHYLHTHPLHPVVFRDLKPNNLMLDKNGRVHLVDFGLARAFPPRYFQRPQPHFKHLRKGTPIGTEGYSPPEQYRGITTPQGDIYALGATLHHLFTRRDPRKHKPFTFRRQSMRALNPAITPTLEDIVMKALVRDPARRWQSARQMQLALERQR